MKFLISLFLTLILSSCASYTPGFKATDVKGNSKESIHTTVKKDEDLSFEDYVFLNVYFENFGSNWVRVKSVEIVDIENHQDARIIIGPDLTAWAKSTVHKLNIDSYNKSILTGTVALTGTAIMARGASVKSEGTFNTGLAIASGALLYNDVQAIMSKVSNLERASLVPEDHVYSPFIVPPHLVTNKWILFQHMNQNKLCSIEFKVTFIDDTFATYKAQLSNNRQGCKDEK